MTSNAAFRFSSAEAVLQRSWIAPEPAQHGGCLRDARPMRGAVASYRTGLPDAECSVWSDIGALDELTYLLESGSDRIGALDFQHSPSEYVPRTVQTATLEELLNAVEQIEQGMPLTPDLDQALFHGTSLGGARPKAMIQDDGTKMIAKFSSSTDTYNVVKAEYLAMRLAAKAGLNVAPVRLAQVAGRDVLLVERFDRAKTKDGWTRKAMVSALTLFGLDERIWAVTPATKTSAEIIRHRRFTSQKATLP